MGGGIGIVSVSGAGALPPGLARAPSRSVADTVYSSGQVERVARSFRHAPAKTAPSRASDRAFRRGGEGGPRGRAQARGHSAARPAAMVFLGEEFFWRAQNKKSECRRQKKKQQPPFFGEALNKPRSVWRGAAHPFQRPEHTQSAHISQQVGQAAMPASLPDLHLDALQCVVDVGGLTPTDAACLALTCRSLADTVRALAPSSVRLRATPGAAAWLATGDRAAALTQLWVDVPWSRRPRSAGVSDGGASIIAALLASGAAPRLARLDVCLPSASSGAPLPSLALAAWLPPSPPALRHLGVHGGRPDATGVSLTGVTSLALDACHASPLTTPRLHPADVAALALPTLTPALRALDIRGGLTVDGGGARPPLPATLTRVRSRDDASAPTRRALVAALLADLPDLASLDVSVGQVGGGVLGPPPRRRVDVALSMLQPATALPLAASLHPVWLADCLTSLTVTHWASSTGPPTAVLDPLAAARRLVALTLVDMGAVSAAPPSLAASLTSLTLHVPRRRANREGATIDLVWPAVGWPALRALEVSIGAAALCAVDASGAPLPPAEVEAAGAELGARLESVTFVAGGGGAAAGWSGLQRAVLSTLRAPLWVDAHVPAPPTSEVASPASAPYDGVTWPVAVAATDGGRLRDALPSVAEGLPSHLRAALFGRGRGGRGGLQAAVAALGRVRLSPDEVA